MQKSLLPAPQPRLQIGDRVIAEGVSWDGKPFSFPAVIVREHLGEDVGFEQVLFEADNKQGTWVKRQPNGSYVSKHGETFRVKLIPLPRSIQLILDLEKETP